MSEHLPKHPMPEIQEDLQEATFAAMRRLLERAKALPELVRVSNRDRAIRAEESSQAGRTIEALLAEIDVALAGEPGRMFVEHMQRLEAENARLRGFLAAFEHCPHGCQDAGFCPHYAKVRKLGLLDPRPVESSAPPGGPA